MATRERSGERSGTAGTNKFLVLDLGGEMYGVDIRKVREIIGIMDITAVPEVPGHVRGVINLRGKIIPVVDTRRRLGLESREATARTCIVVVEAEAGGSGTRAGIIVDAVSEVIQIPEADIEPLPELGGGGSADSVEGLAKVGDRVVILLSIDRVLAGIEGVRAA